MGDLIAEHINLLQRTLDETRGERDRAEAALAAKDEALREIANSEVKWTSGASYSGGETWHGFSRRLQDTARAALSAPAPQEPDRREAEQRVIDGLLEWVDSRIEDEVAHRPDVNIYKRILSETWDQMRRKLTELRAALRLAEN